MPVPDTDSPAFFEPEEASHFYAAQGAFFLVDPARVLEQMGEDVLGSDLVRTLTRKSYPHDLYREGAIVPALGVEAGHYAVHIRSTETESAPLPLSHMIFSTGFVLGTETGKLLLCNTDRLQQWTPGTLPTDREEHPLTSYERTIQVTPGWYSVTVVAGILDSGESAAGEEWVTAFLLDPSITQPTFTAELSKTLNF